MKQNNGYLFVEAPDDAYDFAIRTSSSKHSINDRLEFKILAPPHQTQWGWYGKTVKLKSGKYEVISSTKDITEKEAESIVNTIQINTNGGLVERYLDYMNIIECFNTAKESLQSLIQANGLDDGKNYLILKKL